MKKSIFTLFTVTLGMTASIAMQEAPIADEAATCITYLPHAEVLRGQIEQQGEKLSAFNFSHMGIDWRVYPMIGGTNPQDGFTQVHFWFKGHDNFEHEIQGFSARYVVGGVTYTLQAKTPDCRICPGVINAAYLTYHTSRDYGLNGSEFSGIHWFEAPTYSPENLPIVRNISLKMLTAKAVGNQLAKNGDVNSILEVQVPEGLNLLVKDFKVIAEKNIQNQ